jgi:cytoskeletal protein RodZ
MFKSNKIYSDSPGIAEQLRSSRQAKNLTVKEVAKKLKIKEKYLTCLEKGEYDQLPEGIYGKNFLREYALFLGLNYGQLAQDYEAEINDLKSRRQKKIFSQQVIRGRLLWAMPKILKNILIFLVVLACFAHLVYRLDKIISPPPLLVTSPSADLITDQNSILISGKTEAETNLIINDENVLCDKNGNFSKSINLKNGLNKIVITASKRYGRSNTIVRQVLVKR